MRSHRNRNKRTIRLEMLEMRNAPSHIGLPSGGDNNMHDARGEHRGRQEVQVEAMHNQRGRGPGDVNDNRGPGQDNAPGQNRGPGRNDVVDNDQNEDQNEAEDNDQNEVRHDGGGHR